MTPPSRTGTASPPAQRGSPATSWRMTGPVRARLLSTALAALPSLAVVMPAHAHQAPPDFNRSRPAAAITAEHAPLSFRAQAGMIDVPAGTWTLGRDDAAADQKPAHRVTLAAFRIDRTEVTNSAFAEYLTLLGLRLARPFVAGAATADAGEDVPLLREGPYGTHTRYPVIALNDENAKIGYDGRRFVASPGYENRPVAETTWAGARAYCEWRGARLPTEAEWEAAARGTDARRYPWGNEPPDATRAWVNRDSDATAVVGRLPAVASPFGVLDMAGSVAEWTSSLKRPYPYVASDGRENRDTAGERVTRGGDYQYDNRAETLTASHRNGFSNEPSQGHRQIGVRCATDR